MQFIYRLFPIFLIANLCAEINYSIIQSNQQKLILDINVDLQSEQDLKPISVLIGLPELEYPELLIEYGIDNKISPYWDPTEFKGIEWINLQRLQNLNVATLQIDTKKDNNKYYKNIRITCLFTKAQSKNKSPNFTENKILNNRVINWPIAKNWVKEINQPNNKRIYLANGQWAQFKITEDGMYSIPANIIINSGIETSNRDPRSFKLYTSSSLGRDRSNDLIGTINYTPIKENLIEIGIYFDGENDGKLDEGDQIIFYGRGVSGINNHGIDISHQKNLYFTENNYWLFVPDDNINLGKRIDNLESSTNSSVTLNYGLSTFYDENDLINPFAGGLSWAGAAIPNGSSNTVVTSIESPNQSIDVNTTVGFLGNSSSIEAQANPNHFIEIYHESLNDLQSSKSWVGLVRANSTFSFSGNRLNNGTNIFILKNSSNNSYSQPHFDYIFGEYGRNLDDQNIPYEFFSPIHSNTIRFRFNTQSEIIIWDITDIASPKLVIQSIDNSGMYFDTILPEDTLTRYSVFSQSTLNDISEIDLLENISFSNYRIIRSGVEHLIIGPLEFSNVSAPLVSHRGSCEYISLEQIYNEFSGGNKDPVAIRDFIQWTQENWQNPKPYTVLLMGDADYDYRNITQQSSIKVPTVQIGYSNNHRATDDRLAAFNGLIPDLAIGRYPAKSKDDVSAFVEKIIQYENNPMYGMWRQRITLVADDAARPEPVHGSIATGKSHTQNSETISNLIGPGIEIRKLYMMEYPEVSNSSLYGVIKPDATEELLSILSEGTSIINYIGHGSAHQWAQERLLYQDDDINNINTNGMLPVWIAGTCSWGHFDEIESEAFSEEIIRMQNNGASAIISTTRLISVSSNAYFTREIFKSIFRDSIITNEPIGIIMQSVKDGSSSGELFQLFGDPAMKLALPQHSLDIVNVNPDTLLTLDTARVNAIQEINTNGSGYGFLTLNDADKNVTREYSINSTIQELSYILPGKTLFKGQFSFNGKDFSAMMRVPKDISYSNAPGEINIYMVIGNNPSEEAIGSLQNIILKGGSSVQDVTGPIISFEKENGFQLRNSDHLEDGEKLYLRLSDPIGINLTGEIGHEILYSDKSNEHKSDITHLFIYDENSITTGRILINDLSNENLYFQVKAWDNANNPSEKEIKLFISENKGLTLFNVYNYPNPFKNNTQFSFEINESAEIEINIYTLGGRKIRNIDRDFYEAGYNFINWDGKDKYGDNIANGVYLYSLKAFNDGSKISKIGKIAKYQ